MFRKPMNPIFIPKNAVIICPHLKYEVNQSSIYRACMWFNCSKKVAKQLHAVASTWSSCV